MSVEVEVELENIFHTVELEDDQTPLRYGSHYWGVGIHSISECSVIHDVSRELRKGTNSVLAHSPNSHHADRPTS